jgi:hypothetical protein
MWTLDIIVLDMTWHHVMLSCLSKLFSTTLVTIVIQSNMIINLILNIVFFSKILTMYAWGLMHAKFEVEGKAQ